MVSSRDETPADTGRPRVHGSDAERKAAYRKREQERHAATEADLETLLRAARRLCYAYDLPAHGVPDVIASLSRLAQFQEDKEDKQQEGTARR